MARCYGAAYIFQPHSSDDDLINSASVQDSAFRLLGCVVNDVRRKRMRFFAPPTGYSLDECHVDNRVDG